MFQKRGKRKTKRTTKNTTKNEIKHGDKFSSGKCFRVAIEIKPDDSEVDMKAIQSRVQSISLSGVTWISQELIDVAYGIKKLHVVCEVTDNPDACVDALWAAVGEGVQAIDIESLQPVIRQMAAGDQDHRFDVDDPLALSFLNDHGYVVFKNVLSEQQVQHSQQLLWDFILANCPRVSRDDVSTWTTENWIGDEMTGIVAEKGVGQSQCMWYVRGIPNVKQVFTNIWGTDKLLTSFDGCGIFRPWQYNLSWKTKGGWFHVDQNFLTKQGKHCIQGLVSLFDQNHSTGGLVVIPRSHLYHQAIAERLTSHHSSDFVMMDVNDPVLQTFPASLIECKSGDMICWDSRTIHCNSPADDNVLAAPSAELMRAVCYVCMTPVSMANPEVIQKRRQAAEIGQGTTHWPHFFVPIGIPQKDNLVLTESQRKLIDGT